MNIGLSVKELRNFENIRFFDIDGVLCTYAFGINGIGVDTKGFDYLDYLETHNIYTKDKASFFMKQYVQHYCDREKTFVISRANSLKEEFYKREFIKENYGSFIKDNNIFFSDNKVDTAKSILNFNFDGIDTPHFAIDDSVDVLYKYQDAGIRAVHISSLFILAEHDYSIPTETYI